MIVRSITRLVFVAIAGSVQYNQPASIARSNWEKSLMNSTVAPRRSILVSIVPPLLLFSASFIFCMHWFLLRADSLASGATNSMIPDELRATIIAYYSVVFGDMTWLIKIVILLLLTTMTIQLFLREVPKVLSWAIFIIHAPLIFQGVFRIIPMVDELILNTQTPEVQSQLLRTVHNSHVISAYSAVLMIVLQIVVIVLLQKRHTDVQWNSTGVTKHAV